ncbi:MAG TPA: CRTAC1 family protein [Acidobacteriaceae bacterium]
MSPSRSSAVCLLALSALLMLGASPSRAQSPLESQKQKPQEGAQPAAKGGSDTGGVFPPVMDANHLPITEGGTVKTGPIVFEDIAAKAGLTKWHHTMGTPNKQYIIESIGSGVALLDYDNDGWMDIYLVNGSTIPAMDGKATPPHAALFHNNHDGTFTDVTAKAGVANDRWGFGVAIGDYDNDGWPDIYVTNFGKNRLYHNNHDGTFTDVAEKAGVTLGNWSTGATWGDYDGDGKLDLFVPGYVHYDLNAQPSDSDNLPLSFCSYRGVRTYCGPHGLKGESDHLFHNNGDGTFTDVSEKAGVADKPGYYGLSSVFIDVNNDGKPDLLVGNDSTPNYLYINNGDGTFDDESYPSGYALDKQGRETASMGIAVGDYLNNGKVDIFNTTFSDDYKVLYRNDGDANFTDVSDQTHIADLTIPFLGWGTAFIDYDNDGWKDLLEVNGHVYRNADTNNWGTSWAERPLLFHNIDGKKLDLVPAVEGTGLAEVMPSRGLAAGDLFNDGRMDAVINNMDSVPALFRDVDPNHNHWVGFHLVGGPKSPRDATGATLYLTANGMRQRGDIFSGGSFESTSDMRPHFGIGSATKVDSLEVHWPSGAVEQFAVPEIDRIVTLTEGQGKPVAAPKP